MTNSAEAFPAEQSPPAGRPSPLAAQLRALFAQDGPLARGIEGYRERAQQLEMATRIAEALAANGTLILEAGTGTGKTVAYLVPALLAGGKVIISTGTKTLQDQLFRRDLPTVRDALGVPATIALLKGRANYVCHYHLERNIKEGMLPSRQDVAHLQTIARFARISKEGDKAELAAVPEDAAAWGYATSTRDNCLGQQCPNLSDCFLMKARRKALESDIVVVNHHLFFADVVLRDEGMGELLPACNAVILDEAHQLPEIATVFFGETSSTSQCIELARDARAEALAGARDMPALLELGAQLEKAARDLRLAPRQQAGRIHGQALARERELAPAITMLGVALNALARGFAPIAERSEGLARCRARALELHARIGRWLGEQNAAARPAEAGPMSAAEHLAADGLVRWVEVGGNHLQLHASPLSVAETFRRQVDGDARGHPRAWIFTSATLAVGGDFSHYQRELGLEDAQTGFWQSPFDYPKQALIYLPQGLPEPNTPDHTRAVVEAALPVIRASGGGAFLLFTTLRAMRAAHEFLAEALRREQLGFPLLLQGEGTRSELLERFRKLGNAVLVASSSFWEGVDVRGDALSVVVIDKLPFAPPDDPLMQARLEWLEKQGRNPFMEYQLPQAAITLKQGAGRLIRDERDRGVLVICDNRLASRPYGRKLVASLPPMKRTRSEAEVVAFFDRK